MSLPKRFWIPMPLNETVFLHTEKEKPVFLEVVGWRCIFVCLCWWSERRGPGVAGAADMQTFLVAREHFYTPQPQRRTLTPTKQQQQQQQHAPPKTQHFVFVLKWTAEMQLTRNEQTTTNEILLFYNGLIHYCCSHFGTWLFLPCIQ